MPSQTNANNKVVVKAEPKQNVAAAATMTVAESTAASEEARATYKKLNRFSDQEKHLLFAAFKEHQQIIDIKQRRSSFSSHKQAEVRECWKRIVCEFNEHPDTQERTVRQIQKFWLNSKLRNQIPSIKPESILPHAIKTQKSSLTGVTIVKRTIRYDGTIVPTTPNIGAASNAGDQPQSDAEISDDIKSDPMHMEDESQDMQDEETLEQEDDEDDDVNNLIELKFIETAQQQSDGHHQQPQPQQQVTFQPAMQIVHHGGGGQVQFANVENMEIITQNHQHHQFASATNTITGAPHISKNDRRLFCGSDCGDRNESASVIALDEHEQRSNDHMDPLHHHHHQHTTANGIEVVGYDEQLSEIRLQDAQCRLKESHLRCELQQLAVTRAKEELKQMREIHVLHISEMQLKLDKMKKELRRSLA